MFNFFFNSAVAPLKWLLKWIIGIVFLGLIGAFVFNMPASGATKASLKNINVVETLRTAPQKVKTFFNPEKTKWQKTKNYVGSKMDASIDKIGSKTVDLVGNPLTWVALAGIFLAWKNGIINIPFKKSG